MCCGWDRSDMHLVSPRNYLLPPSSQQKSQLLHTCICVGGAAFLTEVTRKRLGCIRALGQGDKHLETINFA